MNKPRFFFFFFETWQCVEIAFANRTPFEKKTNKIFKLKIVIIDMSRQTDRPARAAKRAHQANRRSLLDSTYSTTPNHHHHPLLICARMINLPPFEPSKQMFANYNQFNSKINNISCEMHLPIRFKIRLFTIDSHFNQQHTQVNDCYSPRCRQLAR